MSTKMHVYYGPYIVAEIDRNAAGSEFTETAVGPQAAAGSNNPFNVGFVDIPAGRWRVDGYIFFTVGTAIGNTGFVGDLNTSSATLRTSPNKYILGVTLNGTQNGAVPVYSLELNVSTTTRVYLIGQYNFTGVGTSTMSGFIKYTRVG